MSACLRDVLAVLERIAPPALAGSWDNIGLLLEPLASPPPVERAILTIDLSEAVLREALEQDASLIVSYHPVLFGGTKSLVQSNPHTAMLLRAARAGVAVYSPHTALDAVVGGICDWLLRALGPVSEVAALDAAVGFPAPAGAGRRGRLDVPLSFDESVDKLKQFLGLPHLRVAPSAEHIETLAVCPGAGGSMLRPSLGVDLIITGEMSHHDVLALNAVGSSVILTEHSNSERGYLPLLRSQLVDALGESVTWSISTVDRDPLSVR